MALGLQLVLQLGEVFDDAVVHDSELAAIHHVRVGVEVRRSTVSGPASVANAQDRVLEWAGFDFGFERRYLTGLLTPANLTIGVHGNARGVIPAVFESAQAFQHDVLGIVVTTISVMAYISNNSTHGTGFYSTYRHVDGLRGVVFCRGSDLCRSAFYSPSPRPIPPVRAVFPLFCKACLRI